MTKERWDGLYFVLLGGIVFLLAGFAIQLNSAVPASDFRALYFEARGIVYGQQVFNPESMQKWVLTQGVSLPHSSVEKDSFANLVGAIYPPTIVAVLAPIAVLPWNVARWIWSGICATCFIGAACLIWIEAGRKYPVVAGALVGLCLSGSQLFLILGNAACVVISACAFAAISFRHERYARAGVLLLSIALLLKPHDAGWIWLCFLLLGATYRKRALQSLGLTIVLGGAGILYTTAIIPNWISQLRTNLAVSYVTGGNDPGPLSVTGHGIGGVINLQTALSLIADVPAFYNAATYLVIGVLIVLWAVALTRLGNSSAEMWLAIAPVAAFTVLPTYHRMYDAGILLLLIPACMEYWESAVRIRWMSVLACVASLVVSHAIFWAVLLRMIDSAVFPQTPFFNKLLLMVQMALTPVTLLLTGMLYLWLLFRQRIPRSTPMQS